MNTNTVRDRNGNVVQRGEFDRQPDDVILDGSVRAPFMLMDGRSVAQGTPHRGSVHTVAMRVLGDAYSAADFAGLSDEAIHHNVVRRKLGDAAAGKGAAFLDAAWLTLVGVAGGASASATPAASHGMTDAQRTVAARGVEAALADAAKRGGSVMDGAPRFAAQDRAVATSAYAEMRSRMSDGWKSEEQRARDAGARADAAAHPLKDQRLAALQERDAEMKARYRACWGKY